ncbi:MAG TPA: zinc-ribbon domain-containing protein [Candidatus Angelobacter sp.]|nr:zinc-ribbon domain-containing protein [Candidatus Angelobacter sp.]
MFCRSCGKEMADNAVFCPSCGAPVRGPASTGSTATPWQPGQQVSAAWYLVPLIFGILGGIIAWAVNKDKDPKRARNLLIFGLVWSLVPIFIGLAVFFYTVPYHVGPTPYP